MRNSGLLIAIACFFIIVAGCGTFANPKPTPLGNNKYQVNVSGLTGYTSPDAITRDWNEAASKACNGGPYNIITRSFIGQKQYGMEGVIECK